MCETCDGVIFGLWVVVLEIQYMHIWVGGLLLQGSFLLRNDMVLLCCEIAWGYERVVFYGVVFVTVCSAILA